MTKVRNGPDCASIGLARDALAGVKHSPAFSRFEPVWGQTKYGAAGIRRC